MNKIAGYGLSALMAATLMIPISTQEAEARRGRNTALAAGVLLGVAAAAAIGSSARADSRRNSYERQCNRLARSCDRGNDRACWTYEDRCGGY
jgi:hypothetical protein